MVRGKNGGDENLALFARMFCNSSRLLYDISKVGSLQSIFEFLTISTVTTISEFKSPIIRIFFLLDEILTYRLSQNEDKISHPSLVIYLSLFEFSDKIW